MKKLLFILCVLFSSVCYGQSMIKPLIHSLSHNGSINDISGNGKKILTCSDDKRAMLWDYDLKLLGEFLFPFSDGMNGILNTCDLSKDGKYAVTGGETGANSSYYFYVLNCNNFKTVDKIAGFKTPIIFLRYSPLDNYLIAIDESGLIKVYSTNDYSEYTTIKDCVGKHIINVEFISEKELFLTTNSRVYYINIEPTKKKFRRLNNTYGIEGASHYTNGDTLIYALVTEWAVRLYKGPKTGKLKRIYKKLRKYTEELGYKHVCFNPAGELYANKGKYVNLYNCKYGLKDSITLPYNGHVSEKEYCQSYLKYGQYGIVGYFFLKAFNNFSAIRLDSNMNLLLATGNGDLGVKKDSLFYKNSNSISVPFSPKSLEIKDSGCIINLYDVQNVCHTIDLKRLLIGKDSMYSQEAYSSDKHYEYLTEKKVKLDNNIVKLKIKNAYSHGIPIVFGGYYLTIGKKHKKTFVLPDVISDVKTLNYRDIFIVVFQNGMVKWFKYQNDQLSELLSFFTDKNNWIFWTPEGDYYSSSSLGDKLLMWVNNRFMILEHQNWYSHYDYNKIRNRIMEIVKVSDSDSISLDPIYTGIMHFDDVKDEYEFHHSQIHTNVEYENYFRIISMSGEEVFNDYDTICVQNENITLKYNVDEHSLFYTPYDISLRLDGSPFQGEVSYDRIYFRLPQRKSYRLTISLNNSDKMENMNQDRTIYLKWTGPEPEKIEPTLRIVALGINRYDLITNNKLYDLSSCVYDAEMIAKAFSTQEAYFKCEEPVVLANNNASKDGLIAQLNRLVEVADSCDVSILFFSGHGVIDSDSLFHFVTGNVRNEYDIMHNTVTSKQIEDFMSHYKGVLILMIDACYSGAIVEELTRKLPEQDLKRIAIFTSSSKYEKSYDSFESDHSFFIGDISHFIPLDNIKGKYMRKITVGDLHRRLMRKNDSQYSEESLYCPAELKNQILYLNEITIE